MPIRINPAAVHKNTLFNNNNDSLEKISQWFEKELGQKIILDLSINPKIVGGVIIEYQGNWRDFSLEKEIDSLIPQKGL